MRKSSVIYKSLTIFSLFTGIVLNIYNNTESIISVLSYYTSQSNLICLISFILFLYLELSKNDKYKNSDTYYLLKGGLVIGIMITMLCYNIALAPIGFDMASLHRPTIIKKITDFLVHTCSPILVILDYVIFDIKGNFKKYYPFLWIIVPLMYVFYVYVYSNLGGKFTAIGGSTKYAYFFLDYEEIGSIAVLKWIVFLVIGVLVLSYLLVYIDRKIGNFKKREKLES